jgi:hypothetical protein
MLPKKDATFPPKYFDTLSISIPAEKISSKAIPVKGSSPDQENVARISSVSL